MHPVTPSGRTSRRRTDGEMADHEEDRSGAAAGAEDPVEDGLARAGRGAAATEREDELEEERVERDIDADLQRLQQELERATDLRLRLAAEFDNYRKRVDRERAESYQRAQADLAKRLLEALDDLDRVSEFSADTPTTAMLEGVQLVEKKMLAILGAAGLEEVQAAGQPFDPNEMEAVATVPTEEAAEDEHVSDVFQKGWKFRGQLIRPARVRVKKHGD